ncbi:yobF [Candidatus Sodalis pierantonius str. SOPE]|uniref:DUF2627 domain-containing protein n=2 Tax=Sodalis TaxID=84565 RepID=W0HSR4_9GAMM|nr:MULTISPECIES: DUF2627 domain-containing protein [Sodalis]AHF73789.1 yobF [Candidatus Sodalis pierantonius str. SOPE]AHF76829.1 hypothetical protein Sant_1776 [Sodalis praecaptivus]
MSGIFSKEVLRVDDFVAYRFSADPYLSASSSNDSSLSLYRQMAN